MWNIEHLKTAGIVIMVLWPFAALYVAAHTVSDFKLDLELDREDFHRLPPGYDRPRLSWKDKTMFFVNIFCPVWNLVTFLLLFTMNWSNTFVEWIEKACAHFDKERALRDLP